MFNFFSIFFKRKPAPKVLEVDDSGAGSLYGGMIILVTDGLNDYYREVSLKIFAIKDKIRRTKSVKQEVAKIVHEGGRKFNANKKETEFHICQGNTFDLTEEALKKDKFKVKRQKIEGRTNLRAEELFAHLLATKYDVKDYDFVHYKKENLRQYELLRKRRDFDHVKVNSNGVEQIKRATVSD
ncbi:hypothetical protein HZC34_04380 [Candidatus Saganbacteria bacterium]|nr:hypothetical protein [Candidatus Saganbacteria bacterium]